MGKPITTSPLDVIHRYAHVTDYTALTQGGIAEFILKTSVFVTGMFALRIALGMGISDVSAVLVIGGIIALYCYSLRSYLNAFVVAVSNKGMVGIACALCGFVALVGVALWV